MRKTIVLAAILIGVAASGCASRSGTVSRYGETLAYDPARRVYVVESVPGVYYESGSYYRYTEGTWQKSPKANGPWHHVKKHRLPPGLRKKM